MPYRESQSALAKRPDTGKTLQRVFCDSNSVFNVVPHRQVMTQHHNTAQHHNTTDHAIPSAVPWVNKAGVSDLKRCRSVAGSIPGSIAVLLTAQQTVWCLETPIWNSCHVLKLLLVSPRLALSIASSLDSYRSVSHTRLSCFALKTRTQTQLTLVSSFVLRTQDSTQLTE